MLYTHTTWVINWICPWARILVKNLIMILHHHEAQNESGLDALWILNDNLWCFHKLIFSISLTTYLWLLSASSNEECCVGAQGFTICWFKGQKLITQLQKLFTKKKLSWLAFEPAILGSLVFKWLITVITPNKQSQPHNFTLCTSVVVSCQSVYMVPRIHSGDSKTVHSVNTFWRTSLHLHFFTSSGLKTGSLWTSEPHYVIPSLFSIKDADFIAPRGWHIFSPSVDFQRLV